jgi:hypothetical protein
VNVVDNKPGNAELVVGIAAIGGQVRNRWKLNAAKAYQVIALAARST